MALLDAGIPCYGTLPSLSRLKHGSRYSASYTSKSVFHIHKIFNLMATNLPSIQSRNLNVATSLVVRCNASEVSVVEEKKENETPPSEMDNSWVPVVPLIALPKGERRLVRQNEENILLLWFKNEVIAIENRSPAEGAYSEGLLNAKLTQDGCIVCPTTDSTFDLKTGDIKEWYPKNPVLRLLTPPLRKLLIYPTKLQSEYIYINMGKEPATAELTEIVFSGKTQAGMTASDVNVDEVRMVVDDIETGFGFTRRNELINGRAAIVGFLLLLNFELLTGKGFLKGTGFLDFLYAASQALGQ